MNKKTLPIIMVSAIVFLFAGVIIGANYHNTKSTNNASAVQETIKNGEMTETENMTIMHKSTTVEDPNLEYGKESIKTFGLNGRKKVTYSVTYENGKEVSRKVVKEEIIEEPQDEVVAKGTKIVWQCIDVTSYNQNAYDDNKCTSSTGEVRYTSDSQAIALDPSYRPGKAGAYYYNNK